MSNPNSCPQCGEALSFAPSAEVVRYCHICKLPRIIVAGKYEILRTLAKGGCGILFVAKHQRLSRDPYRVIKFIDSTLIDTATSEARFAREVEVTSSLSQHNQHIVRVYDDFGEIVGLGHYFVMEYLEGQDLSEYIQSLRQELPMLQAIHIIEQVAVAMLEAHNAGVVHRDLKPQNIFLVERSNEPLFVKVIDFGIAKADVSSSQMGMTQGLLGTPAYMSPEQCSGLPVDHRSDIYSIGIMLYQLIVGRVPFGSAPGQDNSPMQLVFAQVSQTPPSPRDIRPNRNIPEELEAIILKLLSKEPANRFQSLEALLQALSAVKSKIPGASAALIEDLPPLRTLPSQDEQWGPEVSMTRVDPPQKIELGVKELGPTLDMPAEGLPTGDVLPSEPSRKSPPSPSSSEQLGSRVSTPFNQSSETTGMSEEDWAAVQTNPSNWLMAAGVAVVLLLALGAWSLFVNPGSPELPIKRLPEKRSKAKVIQKASPPIAREEPDMREEPPPVIRPKPRIRKRIVRRRRRRRRRVFRRRTRIRARAKVVRRRAPAFRGVKGCPADPSNGRWVLLKVNPRKKVMLQTHYDSESRRMGFCLLLKNGGPRHYVKLLGDGFSPCFFKFKPGARVVWAQMKTDSESEGLAPTRGYCVAKR